MRSNTPIALSQAPSQSRNSWLAKDNLAFGVLLLVCLLTNGWLLFQVWTGLPPSRPSDVLTVPEWQVEELRGMLPRGEKVGFIAGRIEPDLYGESSDTWKYFRMRYALAPVMLDFSTLPELIVGDFSENLEEINRVQTHFFIVRKWGSGIVLLRRKQ